MGGNIDPVMFNRHGLRALSYALSERVALLADGLDDAPTTGAITSQFLLRAGFDEAEIRSWCEPDSEVDLLYVVTVLNEVFDAMVGVNFGKPAALVAYRRMSMLGSGLDTSLCTPELVFYASRVYLRYGSTKTSPDEWESLAAVFRHYPASTTARLYAAGVPLSAAAQMGAAGVDVELALTMLA